MTQLRVVATPTGVSTIQDARASETAELARTLQRFNPSLRRVAERADRQFAKEQATAGTQEALTTAETYAESVRSGSIKFGENPFAQKAYREQIGRNTGLRLSSELERAYLEWDGKDDDDPAAIQGFISGFISENTEDIDDTDVIQGLQSSLATSVNNLQVKHRSYTTDRIATQYTEGVQTEVMSVIGKALVGQTPDADLWNSQVDEIKVEAELLGIPRRQVDELIIQAVSAKALQDMDVAAFDLLDIPRSDGTPPISSKPAAVEAIAQARDQVLRYAWRVNNEGETEETEARAQLVDEFEKELIDAAFVGEGITEDLRQRMGQELGIDEAAQMIGQIKRLEGSTATDNRAWEDQDDLDRANEAAYLRGDVDYIRQMIRDDRIPPGLRATYLNAADTQQSQIISGDRTETRFNERAAVNEDSEEAVVQTAIERGRSAQRSDPVTDGRVQRLSQIQDNHPELASIFIAEGRPTIVTGRLQQAIEQSGEEAARSAFDAQFGEGASVLVLPRPTG